MTSSLSFNTQNITTSSSCMSMVPLIRTMFIFILLLLITCTHAARSSTSRSSSSSSVTSGSTQLPQGLITSAGQNKTMVSFTTANTTNSARVSSSSSVLQVPGELQQAYSSKNTKGMKGNNNNKNRGSRAPSPIPSVVTSATTESNDPGKSLNLGKNGQTKQQSWLAVASAVAHSAAAETNEPTGPTLSTDDSKPTKYHYYPHNQHLYLLPECATQQVCSAVYLRLNYSQPLCACPTFHEPCSVSTRTDDRHTIPLVTGSNSQVLTLVKTCESTQEVRECRAPKDWSILALQNSRTGKAHYLVICRCPATGFLEGPIAHSQPAYARVPGIRVYGMTCVRGTSRTGKHMNFNTDTRDDSRGDPNFPWHKLKTLIHSSLSLIS